MLLLGAQQLLFVGCTGRYWMMKLAVMYPESQYMYKQASEQLKSLQKGQHTVLEDLEDALRRKAC